MTRIHRFPLLLSVPLLLTLAACSSPQDANPAGGVTVLVVNQGCRYHCPAMRVLAYPTGGVLTPGFDWSVELGIMTSSTACFTLPESLTQTVVEVGTNYADTFTFTWTQSKPISLGSVSDAMPDWHAVATTDEFVPAAAKGWKTFLPGTSRVESAPVCPT